MCPAQIDPIFADFIGSRPLEIPFKKPPAYKSPAPVVSIASPKTKGSIFILIKIQTGSLPSLGRPEDMKEIKNSFMN